METPILKAFAFVYLDLYGNELKREIRQMYSLKEARALAIRLWAESNINDLFTIQVYPND